MIVAPQYRKFVFSQSLDRLFVVQTCDASEQNARVAQSEFFGYNRTVGGHLIEGFKQRIVGKKWVGDVFLGFYANQVHMGVELCQHASMYGR